MNPSTTRLSLLDRALLLGCLVAVAALANFGELQGRQNADGLVPVLVSLQKGTPYWWNENRYGMLVPLLALPFDHPLTNKMVQGMWMTFFGAGAFFAIARFLAPGLLAMAAG